VKTGQQARRARCLLRENQLKFWSRVGITQCGGSRYETGRRIPKPVQKLLTIAYGTERQREAALRSLGLTEPRRLVWRCV
jgi:hypothetical protein